MDLKEVTMESKLDELRVLAAAKSETHLLDMFSRAYLKGMFSGEFKEGSVPALIFDRLRTSAQTRLELHRLEREMNHSVFRTLVTSEYLVRSGRDKETGEVVFWYSMNPLNKRRIKAGSPEGKAYFRAQLWFVENYHVQTIDRFALGGSAHSVCVDLEGGLLDFNPWVCEHAFRLVHNLFPIQNRARIYLFGIPKVLPWIVNCAFRLLPEAAETFRFMGDYDDALDIVENPEDVPEFWLSEDASRDKYANARTSTWCFERCLSDTNKVTTKDVFNPTAWPYAPDEEISIHVRAAEKKRIPVCLEVIDEDFEESEDS